MRIAHVREVAALNDAGVELTAEIEVLRNQHGLIKLEVRELRRMLHEAETEQDDAQEDAAAAAMQRARVEAEQMEELELFRERHAHCQHVIRNYAVELRKMREARNKAEGQRDELADELKSVKNAPAPAAVLDNNAFFAMAPKLSSEEKEDLFGCFVDPPSPSAVLKKPSSVMRKAQAALKAIREDGCDTLGVQLKIHGAAAEALGPLAVDYNMNHECAPVTSEEKALWKLVSCPACANLRVGGKRKLAHVAPCVRSKKTKTE
jgi:hypothetical protein